MVTHTVNWRRRLGVAGVLLLWAIEPLPAQDPSAIQDQAVPTSTCLGCHDRVADTRLHQFHSECRTCHTGGAVHVEDPAIDNIGKPAAAQCLACHGAAMKSRWTFGAHEKAEVACRSCHTIHASRTATGTNLRSRRMDQVSVTCTGCHTDVQAQFRLPSHHPVTEGALSCTNCHDPHSGTRTAVRSETDLCGSCHQPQRTPKAIQHAPVTEGCLNCHSAHGSANRRLLAIAQPGLCLQCHSLADNRHAIGAAPRGTLGGAVLRSCVSCHKAIHGSHSDRHLRF